MSGVAGDIGICFIGESFVNGTGDSTYLGWAGRLCQTLSQKGYNVTCYNLGIRRETSSELLLRWEQECDRIMVSPGAILDVDQNQRTQELSNYFLSFATN